VKRATSSCHGKRDDNFDSAPRVCSALPRNHLPRHCRGLVAMLRDPLTGEAVDRDRRPAWGADRGNPYRWPGPVREQRSLSFLGELRRDDLIPATEYQEAAKVINQPVGIINVLVEAAARAGPVAAAAEVVLSPHDARHGERSGVEVRLTPRVSYSASANFVALMRSAKDNCSNIGRSPTHCWPTYS
jgi:hypothetical protein